MLDIKGLLLLAALGVVIILFWRAQAARERALHATRRHCGRHRVKLLDQTVVLYRRRLRWDARSNPRLQRTWAFEFTVTGTERYKGYTVMNGERVESIYMQPHHFPGEADVSEAPTAP